MHFFSILELKYLIIEREQNHMNWPRNEWKKKNFRENCIRPNTKAENKIRSFYNITWCRRAFSRFENESIESVTTKPKHVHWWKIPMLLTSTDSSALLFRLVSVSSASMTNWNSFRISQNSSSKKNVHAAAPRTQWRRDIYWKSGQTRIETFVFGEYSTKSRFLQFRCAHALHKQSSHWKMHKQTHGKCRSQLSSYDWIANIERYLMCHIDFKLTKKKLNENSLSQFNRINQLDLLALTRKIQLALFNWKWLYR